MPILLQHAKKQYVRKDCTRGFCKDKKSATKFLSIFKAMLYLISQNEESIKDYKFIENSNIKKSSHDEPEINIVRRRRRFI